jgi:hypothetical protein
MDPRRVFTLAASVFAASLLPAFVATAEVADTAEYDVRFEATWSRASHPADWPDDAHFSGLVGGVHSADVDFWHDGAYASNGIKDMAERGRTSTLSQEVQAAIGAGQAREVILGGAINPSPGVATGQFTVSRDFPLATVLTMVAPSPDWFTGVDAISLFENGNWVDQKIFTVYAWDAGTDSGATFDSGNEETVPRERIHLLESLSFDDNPIGRFVFTRRNGPPREKLLLGGGRFEVGVVWEDFLGTRQAATPVVMTGDTGYFWFFDPANVELVVKVLDGCGVNGQYWVFASGLTNVRVELEVFDKAGQRAFSRVNPLGTPFAPIQETYAFPCP